MMLHRGINVVFGGRLLRGFFCLLLVSVATQCLSCAERVRPAVNKQHYMFDVHSSVEPKLYLTKTTITIDSERFAVFDVDDYESEDLKGKLAEYFPQRSMKLIATGSASAYVFVDILSLMDDGFVVEPSVFQMHEEGVVLRRFGSSAFGVGPLESRVDFDTFYNCTIPYVVFSEEDVCVVLRKMSEREVYVLDVDDVESFADLRSRNTCNQWVLVPTRGALVSDSVFWADKIAADGFENHPVFFNFVDMYDAPREFCAKI